MSTVYDGWPSQPPDLPDLFSFVIIPVSSFVFRVCVCACECVCVCCVCVCCVCVLARVHVCVRFVVGTQEGSAHCVCACTPVYIVYVPLQICGLIEIGGESIGYT